MAADIPPLTVAEKSRFKKCPVECKRFYVNISSLAAYFEAIAGQIRSDSDMFWFRGHSECNWSLTPGALRPKTDAGRQAGLDLISDFKRIAEAKLPRVPEINDEFKWAQIAQHYGLPTRLLDWTESATTALYFACLKPASDGLVFLLNPAELNRLGDPSEPRILDPQTDRKLVLAFLNAGSREPKKRKYPVAVNPVWNSERIIVQRGTFTLHGTLFSLDRALDKADKDGVPSLVAVPILKESKPRLRSELRRVGVDEMTLFPELEHSCRHLTMCRGLMDFD